MNCKEKSCNINIKSGLFCSNSCFELHVLGKPDKQLRTIKMVLSSNPNAIYELMELQKKTTVKLSIKGKKDGIIFEIPTDDEEKAKEMVLKRWAKHSKTKAKVEIVK